MWRRIVSSHLKTLAADVAAASPRRSIAATARPVGFFLSANRSAISAASSVFPRHFSSESVETVATKKVEDVMPIATGHEKEELEAELEGRRLLDIDFPEGPFGTKAGRSKSRQLFFVEMAAALSSRFLKGIGSLQVVCSSRLAFASVNQNGMMRFSSTVPSDSDTHDDFKLAQKVPSGSTDSLKDIVDNDVKENPVMIYMKGVPESPQCGFSSLAVRVLQQYNVPIGARNILEDQELKNAVKSFSHWPTFPQIFIKGEFIGGSDIILNMHKEGELEEKLKDVSGNQKSQ